MDNKIAKIMVLLFMDNEIAIIVVLWGGEMNSEAVSVGDTASLLGYTYGLPRFFWEGGGRLEGGF